MGAAIRFFCVVGPRSPTAADWWPDISYAYLRSLQREGHDVRAISIGAGYLQVPRTDPQWSHWLEVQTLFAARLGSGFVNVVCSPPRLNLGMRRTRKELAPPVVEGVPPSTTGGVAGSPDEILYEPSTALEMLHTDGHINIAITGCSPSIPTAREALALRRYTVVICPRPEHVDSLQALGAAAVYANPETFASQIRSYLDDGDS